VNWRGGFHLPVKASDLGAYKRMVRLNAPFGAGAGATCSDADADNHEVAPGIGSSLNRPPRLAK